MSKMMSTEEQAMNTLKDKHPNFDFGEFIYVDRFKPSIVICDKHGKFNANYLTLYHYNGCPSCIRESTSKMESLVANCLSSAGVIYEEQKTFPKCKNIQKLRFDFYIEDMNVLIECQGLQHFEPIEFFGGIEGLRYRLRNDSIKAMYCKEHNIKLIYILPWWSEKKNVVRVNV